MVKVLAVLSMFLAIAVTACVLAMLFTLPAMLIWNGYAVEVFKVPTLTFWQSFWLLFLVRLIAPSGVSSK